MNVAKRLAESDPIAHQVFALTFEHERGTMPGRKHDYEEIVAKLRHVEQLVDQGQPLADAITKIGVAEATYYRWRKELGTLSIDQMQRLKELELENVRLKQAVLNLTIDKMTLLETLKNSRA